MNDLNSFIAVGRLTRDTELRYTAGGTATCKFGLAVNRSYKKGEEEIDQTLFINVVAWGKQGENCSTYLHKGSKIAVNGTLTSNRWEDKEGNKRTSFEINAMTIQFLDNKPKVEPEENIVPTEKTEVVEEEGGDTPW